MRKSLGSKRKELGDSHIATLTKLFGDFTEAELVRTLDAEGREVASHLLYPGQTPPEAPAGGKIKRAPLSRILPNEAFGYRSITVERPLRDDQGRVILGQKGKSKGKPQPDSALRDTENVPLAEDVQAYFARAVLPHAPDAWIDPDKTRIGYEIPFNRHFYVFEPPRPLAKIDADLAEVTARIQGDAARAVGMKRYPAYKDSGVDWLGEVPEGWDIVQSRRHFAERKERARQSDRQLTASQKLGIVSQEEYISAQGMKVMQVITGADILKHVEPNDFVISMRSFEGGLEYSKISGCISSAYVMLIPSEKVQPDFYKYLFKSATYIQALQSTTNLVRDGQALRYDNFCKVDIPLPPLPEQMAIAGFLDREVGKIDALVQEQRRLIALLAEKRQAVISHAVTRGLNPATPLKPSGIDWLGDIPEGWDCWKIAQAFRTISSGTTPPTGDLKYYEEGIIPWINTGDLNDGTVSDPQKRLTQRALQDFPTLKLYPPGSLVIALYGATIGKLAITGIEACVNQACCVMSGSEVMNTRFLFYWLWAFRQQIISLASGGGQPNISQEIVRNLRLASPSLVEQSEIVAFLDSQTAQVDALTTAATSAIALLQERRAALISAAVTGKIDLRDISSQSLSEPEPA
jgi:type I restriction enzyme S subunit